MVLSRIVCHQLIFVGSANISLTIFVLIDMIASFTLFSLIKILHMYFTNSIVKIVVDSGFIYDICEFVFEKGGKCIRDIIIISFVILQKPESKKPSTFLAA